MAYGRTKRGAFKIGEESSWGAGAVATAYLKCKEVSFPSGTEYSAGDDIVQKDSEDAGSVLYQPGDVQIKLGLHPFTSSWPTAKPVLGSKPPISFPLEGALGGVFSGGYGVTTTGNTTTVLQFDPYGSTPAAKGFVAGEPVWVRTAAGTHVHGANAIKAVDDVAFTITLRSPLPSVPGDLAIVYGGYAWPKLISQTPKSYEGEFFGELAAHYQDALGMVVSAMSISAPHRGLAELSVTFRSARPVPMVHPETGGTPAVQTYSYPEASQCLFGGLYAWNGATNTKLTGDITIDFGIELQEDGGIAGVDPNGIAGYIQTARIIRVKCNPAYTDNAIIAAFENASTFVLTGWWGVGPRNWMFQVPQAMLVNPVNPGDDGGMLRTPLEFGCQEYTGDTGVFADNVCGDKSFILGALAG